MKLTVVFSYLIVFQLYAGVTYSQNMKTVSLSLNNVTVEEAINRIEKETSYSFLFTDETVDIGRKVNIHVDNGDITDVLSQLLRSTDVGYQMIDKQIILAKSRTLVFQQEGKKTVKGTVIDETGEPVIGANIKEKGTTNGIVTDADGKFSLNVADNAVLQISYIGYIAQEISKLPTDGKSLLITPIEDTQALDEVVVVGYGTQKKVNLTGAVAQIKGDILENRAVTNLSQALQGQVANLNIAQSSSGGAPGATQSINIRGYTGLGSTASPLVVIDGIQGGDINSINMNDVENISVLKDAASSAIYGSSAPYGVILITTKRGKTGQKPTITYNNNFGWAQPVNLPRIANSLDFVNFQNEAFRNADRMPMFSDEAIQRIKDYQAGIITDETYKDPAPGSDSWVTWQGNANNDWFDIYFKDFAFSQQHNVGVSGGTNHSNYYIGLGYNQQEGLYNYGKDSYQRFNVRANLSSELTKWLTFNFKSAFSRGVTDTPYTYPAKTGGNWMHQISRKWPTAALYNPDGYYSYPSDVVFQEEAGRNKSNNDNALLTGEFVIHPLTGWDITANYTFDGWYNNGSQHLKTLYYYLPSGKKELQSGTTPNSFSRSNSKNQHHTVNIFSSYEKQLGSHYFKVLAGFTQELYDNLSVSAGNNYLYSDNLPVLSLTYGTTPSVGDGASQLAVRGGFGRINYNYKEKYLIEFDGRYDGTSRFLKDVRNKFYPGVSAGWMLSKESFWKPLEQTVNTFKIKAGYASLGDQSFTGYYPFYPSLSTSAPTSGNWLFSGGRESYISQPGLINPLLTWVTSTTMDVGVEMTLLSNRLSIDFDWYKRKSDDFVGPAEALPAFLGTSAPQDNNAAMETNGFDLTVGWRDRIDDFSYGINAVLSDYKGKVVKYPNPNRLNTTWYEGQNMGDIWGYETYGLFQSDAEIASAPSQAKINASQLHLGDVRYVDLDGNGEIDWGDNTLDNPGDRKVIGNTTPRYSFGVNMNAEYKGFDFVLFLQGVGKRDAWLTSNIFWGIDADGSEWQANLFTLQSDRWTEDNPDGYYPRYYMSSQMRKNEQIQTRYLQNAAYLRVKNMQLGYTLPESLIRKIDCRKIRLFVNIENLATLTKMAKTIDPEFSNVSGYSGSGDGKVYPLQRTWACGLNITF
ncbi:MAG: TonB-dependent receptor [Tannerella sp.]|nr:TonB-dependent receptor [Tannerella sp.]